MLPAAISSSACRSARRSGLLAGELVEDLGLAGVIG